jgi:hypothetical protein
VEAEPLRALLAELEAQAEGVDLRPALALLAGQALELDEAELNPALRRAVFVVAAGGDPHRELDVEGRAVTTLAGELDSEERRVELARSLARLREAADPFPRAAAALDSLMQDDALAWRSFACALLVDELND